MAILNVQRMTASFALVTLLLLCACGEQAGEAQPRPAATGAPALAELQNATYSGFEAPNTSVTLTNGRWEGAPFEPGAAARPAVSLAPGFRVTGDLDGDGQEEAAVVLAQSNGGSGTFDYLAVMKRNGTRIDNIGTVPLGDRVQIRSLRIDARRILVSTVQAGPADAACCPGDLTDRAWTWNGNRLTESAAVVTGRLSLDALAGTEWVLRAWNVGEAAPADVEVTLQCQDGRFAGKSGCNRYTCAPQTGSAPGELSVGPAAGTRMACPEPQSAVEERFLKQLGAANRFGFWLGQLALSYHQEGAAPGTMLFSARAPQ